MYILIASACEESREEIHERVVKKCNKRSNDACDIIQLISMFEHIKKHYKCNSIN